ncbi:MAG: LuxR family transcriptional regulator [Jatrophihabitantaceae bacterium]|nr:LuxR family transcriptional regulator [Jatrophihabitantaceae bacterium]
MPLIAISVVVVLVVIGQARGLWLANAHNGLLGLAFTFVGAYVLYERPGHREGLLFLSTGIVEAVMFLGRQIGHSPTSGSDRWWGWLGVWPLVIALALATLSVIGFPDGRLPSAPWRWVIAAVVAIAATCAMLSAIWPVEYAAAGVETAHPINAIAPDWAASAWSAIAHPAYAGFQILWVVAVATRWRSSGGVVRNQLALLIVESAASLAALGVGLAGWGSPTPGLLTATLVPVAAGWAIVHGQQVAAYSALTWLSRSGTSGSSRPTELAQAVASALAAPGATLWMGADDLHAVGVWPDTDLDPLPTTAASLGASGLHLRLVSSNGEAVGALTVDRPVTDRLSVAQSRLFDDLASQAVLVLDHLGLSGLIAQQQSAGQLDGLTPREQDVLELIARGLSNSAICGELHLSIKTVEPIVSAIFAKLGLHADAASNRRVLAALAYLRT